MGEIKVETGTTSSKISNITSAGTARQYDAINDSLETTNISPFVEFAAASESLSKAIANYSTIVTQDAKAMQSAVNDFNDNDQYIAGQINNSQGLT